MVDCAADLITVYLHSNLLQTCMATAQQVKQKISDLYKRSSRQIFATLVRVLGDFDLAEEALQDAFDAAVSQWPHSGLPDNPYAWLVSTGRFKAIDRLRRQQTLSTIVADISNDAEGACDGSMETEDEEIKDDLLRLIFTCCHPSIAPGIQTALTLREVCGLTTESIAQAFLVSPATMAQRIVRGKAKIRQSKIPFELPGPHTLNSRLDAVLMVIYLVFNEGYCSTSGETVTRADLTVEALRLGELMVQLMPDAEVMGLLALMLLHEARASSRVDSNGDIILLQDQQRQLWDQALILRGAELVRQAMDQPPYGIYTLQAAICLEHAKSASFEDTDWAQILTLYSVIMSIEPSPVVALNRAVALSMVESPQSALLEVKRIVAEGTLTDYHLAYCTYAELSHRVGNYKEAAEAYQKALSLVKQHPEKRIISKKLRELERWL